MEHTSLEHRNTAPPSVQDQSLLDRLRLERTAVNWPARCTSDSQLTWDVFVSDASEGGFGISSDLPVPVGAILTVSLKSIGIFPCKVAWKGVGRCGLQLLEPIGSLSSEQVEVLAKSLLFARDDP